MQGGWRNFDTCVFDEGAVWHFANAPASRRRTVVEQLKEEGTLPNRTQLRQCKYLNNLVEQDHRFVKRRVNAGLGFFSFKTAGRTIKGYEAMRMVRKGQVEGVGKGNVEAQVRFVERLKNGDFSMDQEVVRGFLFR